jgi:hypothetical protein
MTELQLLDLNEVIQIDESFGVSLDAQIQDVRELGEVKSSSSKPLFIRSTERINNLFGQIFNINAVTLNFDTNVKQLARLVKDGETIADGYFQIVKIDYISKAEYIYEVVVFDEQTDFFTSIEENELSDLDFSQYDHTYDLSEIEFSWGKDADSLPYIYLLHNSQESSYWTEIIDFRPAFYVKWLVDYIFAGYGFKYDSDFFNSDLFKELVIPFSSNDGLPTIPDEEVENRKFILEGDTGLIQSALSTEFMPSLVNNENAAQIINIVRDIRTLPVNDQTSGDTNLINEGQINPANFGEITYYTPQRNGADNLTFEIPVTLMIENLIAFDIEPSPTPANVLSRAHAWFVLELRKRKPAALDATTLNTNMVGGRLIQSNLSELIDTVAVPIPLVPIEADGIETINDTIVGTFQNVQVEQGAEYYFTIQLSRFLMSRAFDPAFRTNVLVEIDYDANGAKIFNDPIKVELNEGSVLNINEFLPQNFKQKDFLRSLTQMFNLKWQPIGNNTIQVEPRDEFYKKGNIIDLRNNNEFFFTKKPSQYKAVNELQTKEIVFRYKDDADSSDKQEMLERRLQKDYFDAFKEYYGQQRIKFDNENLRGERVIEPMFSPTIAGYSTAIGVEGRRYICSLMDARNPKCNYRILFVNRLSQTGRNVINLNKATKVYNTTTPDAGQNYETVYLSDLVIGTHYRNDPFEPTFDLNFGRARQTLFPTKGTDNNLFNTFWINDISTINTAKMVIGYCYISNYQYARLKLNDVLYGEKNEFSRYYIINKIIEYNAKTGEAKLELITYDPSQQFPRFARPIFDPIQDQPINDFDTNINNGLPSDSIDDEFTIVNGVNNEGQGGNIINGNHNVVGKKSIASGDYNVLGEKVFAFGDNNEVVEKKNVFILGDGYTDADVEDNTIVADKIIAANQFKIGEVSQTSTNDPTFTSQVDGIGLVSFTRFSTGTYDLLFTTDAFLNKSVNCQISNGIGNFLLSISKRTDSSVRISTRNLSETLVDGGLEDASIIIEVY